MLFFAFPLPEALGFSILRHAGEAQHVVRVCSGAAVAIASGVSRPRQAIVDLLINKAGAGAALGVRGPGQLDGVLVRALVLGRVFLHVLEPPDGRTQARERLH